MKKFFMTLAVLVLSLSIFGACSTPADTDEYSDAYTEYEDSYEYEDSEYADAYEEEDSWDLFGLSDIFSSDSIEGTWTLAADRYDYEQAEDLYDFFGGYPELTFCEDGTILEYIPADECEYENGYWEEAGDGHYILYDSMLGEEAVVDGDELWITGWLEGYASVYTR